MTEQERTEAERLIKERVYGDPSIPLKNAWFDGFEAACDAKRAELEDVKRRGDAWRFNAVAVVEAELKAEREKAGELVEAIENIAHEIDLSEWQKKHGSPSIAFFSASKLLLKALAKFRGEA